MTRSTRVLLRGGALAAPLFLALWALQAFTRDGFRPTFHPVSLLSLGDQGWMQITTFIVTGLLVIGSGVGLGRSLGSGRLIRWASALVVLMGVGLILAGVFVTDAGAGFPAGAPQGAPQMSWHGAVHEVGFILTQLSFTTAAVMFAVHFGRRRRRGWMATCAAALAAALLVAALGSPDSLAIRMVVSATIELGLIAALAAGALVTHPAPSDRVRRSTEPSRPVRI